MFSPNNNYLIIQNVSNCIFEGENEQILHILEIIVGETLPILDNYFFNYCHFY